MKPITVDLVTNSPLGTLPGVMEAIRSEFGDRVRVRIYPVQLIDGGRTDEEGAFRELLESDIILYDVRGNGRTYHLLKRVYESSPVNMCSIMGGSPDILGLTRLGAFSVRALSAKIGGQAYVDYTKMKDMRGLPEKLAGVLGEEAAMDAGNWLQAIRYWTNPHDKNLRNLILSMAMAYGHDGLDARVEPPIERPDHGIYHPGIDRAFEGLDEYLAAYGYDHGKPTVGILYYGNVHYDVSVVGVRALLARLEPHVNVIPVFGGGVDNLTPLRKYFLNGKVRPDALISIIWFRLNGGPMGGDQAKTIGLLESVDAPVFTPVTMYSSDIRDWAESKNGAGGVEALATVVFPETDGSIEPIPIFGLEPLPGYGEARAPKAIEDRVDRISGRVLRRLALKYKLNAEKKIALIIYDYPPGEANVGSAAYLDTFKSVEAILGRLREEGYAAKPLDAKAAILSAGAVNSPEFLRNDRGSLVTVPPEAYLAWYARLPEWIRGEIERDWGPPPGKIMADKSGIILPIIEAGNVLLCVQPSRGVHEDRSKAYHDKHLTPHHQYIAFYLYLREHFRADALVHVGTHGTIEFLPGKEVALSSSCYPDLLMGDTPHFYFYHVTNPSEAVIAKRRAYGTLINYAPPSFTTAGLYGDLLELEDMASVLLDPMATDAIKGATLENVRAACERLGMDFEGPEKLHEELASMKASVIPRGLHVLGQPYGEASLEQLLAFIAERGYEGDVSELRARIGASDELGALVHGLGGGYILPNIAGDPIRTPEVFPTGRNSYQFDPKLIPTKAAYERGALIAGNTLKRFREENGRYPETVGMVLWGFETAKTRGETVGQALAYLGLKVVHGKGWYPAIQVVPLEELGRPRIDVNVNICGFFRDMFPNVVALLDKGIRKIAALDESPEMNFIKKHSACMRNSLRASGADASLADARIFGPAQGEYGTNLPSIIETSNWESEDQLASEYTRNMGYAYGDGFAGLESREAFEALLGTTELVSQVRDTNEYEVGDLDHYYEFLGGLARATGRATGKKPLTLVSDTTLERIRTVDASKAVTRGTYTRLLNPAWIEGMLEHDFHGAKKVADRVEYLIGFAATVGVKGEVFQNVAGRLVFDKKMLEALRRNNLYATREISRRLLEAERRGYWKAGREDHDRLMEIYLGLEEEIEGGAH